jgi:hypothetical protein
MEFASELEASLREFAPSGSVEIRENGGRLAHVATFSWEVRGASEKSLLHIWSDQYNLTRRVLAITDHSGDRLALAVERFGRSKPAITSPISKLSALVWPKAGARVFALSCGSNNFSFLHSIIPVTSRSRPCKMLLSYLGVMFWLFPQKLGTMVRSPSLTSPDV